MENPATWGEAESVINEALQDADIARRNMVCGLSRARRIADALRKAGLLNDETYKPPNLTWCHHCKKTVHYDSSDHQHREEEES